jgi:tetratricopeptide (TPR) repeat protein/cell division protein FtsN
VNHPYAGKFLRLLLLSFLICFSVTAQQSASSEDELKKQAEKAFVAENYEDALSPYSQLLSLYPRNATYNYRYGVALLKAGKNKTNAVSYLEAAAKDPANPEEVWIYLGQAYMIIGKFDDALGSFRKFEAIVNSAKLKKFNSEELKANCMNAIELLKTRKNIIIVSSKEVSVNEFYKFFSWTHANGKIVPAAEQFLTSMDKDKQKDPVMFIANDRQTIYLSSFGKKGENGKDLYIVRKMPNGQWSEPENLGPTINSEMNEDFPYLDRDGRTLYFSAKSKKSIGGYDVFKSKFDFNSGKWSAPENLGWPINTISDDYLYVPVIGTQDAHYATGINTSKNEIEIRRIQLPDQGEALVTITGYYAPTDQKVRRDARITILRGDGEGIVTSVYTDPFTGKYDVTLEPGQDYIIVVEGGGYLPHSESFSLPSQLNNSELKQIVKVTRENTNENLTLENYFYPASAVRDVPSEVKSATYDVNPDTSSLMAVQINNQTVMVTRPGSGKPEELADTETTNNDNLVTIEKKDEYDPTLEKGATADEIKQKNEEDARAKEIVNDSKKSDNYDITIGNEELAAIAIMDANSARQEADSLLQEVERLKVGAVERDSISAQAMSKAETASELDKPTYLNEAYTMKADADNMRRQAADLSVAAIAKDAEAKASEEEAEHLLATIDGGKGTKGPKSVATETTKPVPAASDSNVAQNSQEKSDGAQEEIKELSPSETPVTKAETEVSENSTEPIAKSETDETITTKNEVPEIVNQNTDSVQGEETAEDQPVATESSTENKTVDQTAEQKVAATEVAPDTKASDVIAEEKPVATESSTENKTVDQTSEQKVAASEVASENKATDVKEEEKSVATESSTENKTADQTTEQKVVATEVEPDSKTSDVIAEDKPIATESSPENKTADQTTEQKVVTPEVATENKTSDVIAEDKPVTTEPSTENKITDQTAEQKVATTEVALENKATDAIAEEKPVATESSPENKTVDPATEQKVVATEVVPDNKASDVIAEEKAVATDSSSENNAVDQTTEQKVVATEVAPENKTSDVIAEDKPVAIESSTENKTVDQTVEEKTVASETATNNKTEEIAAQENTVVSDSATENKNSTAFTSTVELKPPFIVPAEEQKPFPPDINTLKVNPVNEEARVAYQAFKSKYRNAKQLSDQSVELQNRIVNSSDSPEKDSLIRISNNLSDQSEVLYTEAQDQLKAAQVIDPEVKNKMEVNEQIIAYNSSMPTNNANNTNSPTLNAPDQQKTETETKTETVEQPIVSKSEETPGDVVEKTPEEVVVEKPTETVAENAPVVNEYELTPEEAKAVDEVTTFTVETPNGKEVVKIDTVGINTRHPEFQKYVEVNKEITNKQVETIDVFAEAVNQQKLAVEQKQEQNKWMDKAEVEQDRPTKAQIFIKADAYRDSSKKNEAEAAEKFAIAQSKTSEVKNKTAEMQEIRQRIAIPGRELPKQATNSKINPQGLTEEELTAMSQPVVEGKPVNTAERNQSASESANNTNAAPAVVSTPATSYTPEKVQEFAKQSFSIANAPVYNKENPIPMNPPIPDGLVFKVQIGAFRNEIPAEKFQGVQPITAETTRPGWVRYCVGLFQTFEPAVVVKKEMQQRGFKDAFVVAYLNGKRIGLDEAYAMIAKNKSRPDNDYVASSQTEMALLRANNVRPENISSIRNNVIDADEKTFYGENASSVKRSLAVVEYAVQVGVYKTQTTPRALQSLTPLFTERIRNNLYRFTSDHYVSYASADSMKQIARRAGVRDAFIVVYRNGVQSALSSVPIAERRATSSPSVPVRTTPSQPTESRPVTSTPAVSPTSSLPTAVESGEKIIYRVQLGAFKNNIPFTAVVSFLNVADKGITQQTDDRGLHIFYAGSFDKFSDAATLKTEVVSKGVTDAFVVALQGGKRVVLTDAMKNEVK